MRSLVEILVAVNVPQRHVIQRWIFHQARRQDDIPTDFDSLLAAKLCPGNRSMRGQNGWKAGVKIRNGLI